MFEFKGFFINKTLIAQIYFCPEAEAGKAEYYLGEWRSRIIILFNGGANSTILATKEEFEQFKEMCK